MFPYNRGKRILELSLQNQRDLKQQKVNDDVCHEENDEPSVLDISSSQLLDLSTDLNVSFDTSVNFSDIENQNPLSLALKASDDIVHNFIESTLAGNDGEECYVDELKPAEDNGLVLDGVDLKNVDSVGIEFKHVYVVGGGKEWDGAEVAQAMCDENEIKHAEGEEMRLSR